MDQRSLNFLTNMHRKLGQRSCIQKSGLSEKDKAAGATQSKEKNENARNGRARRAGRAGMLRQFAIADGLGPILFPLSDDAMIGEGTKSTNQRRHTYVRDNVEVGFFTDPTVCIGCKACEVACKEWNHVPDDGFVWSGNSYDNTGHLGASTWRHVMFVEQDRQKGGQIVGSHSLVGGDGEDPFRWIFFPMFASTARKPVASKRVPRAQSFALKSAQCSCRTTFATAADIASSRALLA